MVEIEFLRLINIHQLGLLVLAPLIWFLLSKYYKKRKIQTKEFVNPEIVGSLSQLPTSRTEVIKRIIVACFVVLVVSSIARLQYYGFDRIPLKEQVGIVVVLDISRSMTAEQPHFGEGGRLGAAKREIEDFVSQLSPGYRLGLLLFAGNVLENIPPLTSNYQDFLHILREADPGWISDQGTDIEWAIKGAVDMFDEKAKIRIIILVSDGEREGDQDTEGALDHAFENKVTIYAIGVGKDEAPIPDYNRESWEEEGYLKDENGELIMTMPDEEMLRDVARGINRDGKSNEGAYTPYDQKEKLVEILNQIIKKAEISSRIKVPRWKDLSQWFLLAAVSLIVLLWLIEGGLFQKRKQI